MRLIADDPDAPRPRPPEKPEDIDSYAWFGTPEYSAWETALDDWERRHPVPPLLLAANAVRDAVGSVCFLALVILGPTFLAWVGISYAVMLVGWAFGDGSLTALPDLLFWMPTCNGSPQEGCTGGG